MRLLIASDIHGSSYFAKALLERIKEEEAEAIVLLGDILYHGPRNDLPVGYAPKQVIELLNPLANELLCVRGNCEAEVDQMVLSFPVLADYAWLVVNGISVFATHGHLHGEQNPPPLKNGSLLLCGHTHVPAYRKYETFTYVNPGSVSIPKEGSAHSYMTLEDRTLTWKDLDGKVYQTETV